VSALDVLPLDAAKRYLNIPLANTIDDGELTEFIGAAVQRVERHLFGENSAEHLDPLAVSALQVLAVKVVLAEYWRTQRYKTARAAGGSSGTAIEADSGPAGLASLQVRLTELLGPPADGASGGVPAPVGEYPPVQAWPDPPFPSGCVW
jgi:hypothetical protein